VRTAFALVIFAGLIWAVPCAWAVPQGPVADGVQLTLDQMLSIAEKQHEIARLLIKEGQYDRVLPEMRKILDLNLQGDYEQLVAKSASLIAHLLTENRQYALAHELLDETLARMQLSMNAASLLKIKAYIYKSEGKLPKAIETLERAVEIERQQSYP
jgi:tetratricopeptide (TPR) repeat protein